MKDTQVSLKRTSLLSVIKQRIYLTTILRAKRDKKSQNINVKSLREENSDRPIFVQININSIRNKFQFLASQVINNVDVLLVSETKLDDSFPTAQFLLNGFSKSYRLDRCSNGGRLLLYIKDDISSRLLTDKRKSTKPQ